MPSTSAIALSDSPVELAQQLVDMFALRPGWDDSATEQPVYDAIAEVMMSLSNAQLGEIIVSGDDYGELYVDDHVKFLSTVISGERERNPHNWKRLTSFRDMLEELAALVVATTIHQVVDSRAGRE